MSLNRDEADLVAVTLELQRVITLPTFASNRTTTDNLRYCLDMLTREMMVAIGNREIKEFLEN